MAHTPRDRGEKRPHPELFRPGTTVGCYLEDGLVKGHVTSTDEGGWIYVSWERGGHSQLPGYLRSTQVFKVEGKDGTRKTNS